MNLHPQARARAERWAARGLLCLLLAFAGAAGASAQATPDPARAHYEVGVQEFRDGHFNEAIGEFKAADALRPSPALSFNIAQAYERLADLQNARHYYEEYLDRNPKAEDRRSVEATIASIDAKLAQAMPSVNPILVTPDAPPVAEVETPRPRSHVASALLLGAGAVGLLTGGALNFAAASAANGVQPGGPATGVYGQVSTLYTGALIGYGVGALLGVAGVVTYLLENNR